MFISVEYHVMPKRNIMSPGKGQEENGGWEGWMGRRGVLLV